MNHVFHLVNVFAEQDFGGNPLAVFTSADDLTDAQMQAVARQMNLSETVFVQHHGLPEQVAARLRIFTPGYELPFAGHPLLGAAAVLHDMLDLGSRFALQTRAGMVPVALDQGVYTFSRSGSQCRPAQMDYAALSAALGLPAVQLASPPCWCDAGSSQLLVQLASRQAVVSVRPVLPALAGLFAPHRHRVAVYVWHAEGDNAHVRLFAEQNGQLIEDPGTGSACANLGAWCWHQHRVPLRWRVHQGDEIGRPNRLYLQVSAAGEIRVGGKVMPVGYGRMAIAAVG